jgi:hypothetical protein
VFIFIGLNLTYDMSKNMKIEDLAKEYSDKKVAESPNNEYKNYSQTKQKELTRFDGYDIEQAYEDGGKAVLEKIMQAIRDKKTGTRFGDVIDCIRELRGDD